MQPKGAFPLTDATGDKNAELCTNGHFAGPHPSIWVLDESLVWADRDKRVHAVTAKPPTTNAISLGSEKTVAATSP